MTTRQQTEQDAATHYDYPSLVEELRRENGALMEQRDNYRAAMNAADQDVKRLQHLLNNLLAVVHRDGGHYVVDNGIVKAVQDACGIVVNDRATAQRYERALQRLYKHFEGWDDDDDEFGGEWDEGWMSVSVPFSDLAIAKAALEQETEAGA